MHSTVENTIRCGNTYIHLHALMFSHFTPQRSPCAFMKIWNERLYSACSREEMSTIEAIKNTWIPQKRKENKGERKSLWTRISALALWGCRISLLRLHTSSVYRRTFPLRLSEACLTVSQSCYITVGVFTKISQVCLCVYVQSNGRRVLPTSRGNGGDT